MSKGIIALASEGYGIDDIQVITGKCYADIALALASAVTRRHPELRGLLRIADDRATEAARRAA